MATARLTCGPDQKKTASTQVSPKREDLTEYLQVSEVLRRFPSRLADLREPTGEPTELWFPAGRGYADGVALALRIRFMAVAPLVSAGLIS